MYHIREPAPAFHAKQFGPISGQIVFHIVQILSAQPLGVNHPPVDHQNMSEGRS